MSRENERCVLCGGVGAHVPTCREMFWPDGRKRGMHPPAGPPIKPRDLSTVPIRYSSPLSEELGKILGGISEKAIRAHLIAAKKAYDADHMARSAG